MEKQELLNRIIAKPFESSDFVGFDKLHRVEDNMKNEIIFHDGTYQRDLNHFYECPRELLRRIILHLNKNRDLYMQTGNMEYAGQILILVPRTWNAFYE